MVTEVRRWSGRWGDGQGGEEMVREVRRWSGR